MTDRIRPYIDETYPEMMQRLRESLPPEESMATRVQRWRQSSDESLKLLNFFGDNINIGNSENYLRYTTAKGLELSGDLNARNATITGSIVVTGGDAFSKTSDDLDDISDGSSFGRIASTSITAGKIVLTAGAGVDGSLPVTNTDADITSANTSADTSAVNSLSSTTLISGGLIGTNLVNANSIVAASITAAEIKGSDFGTLSISSGKISIAATDGIEITSGNNIKILSGGDLVLIGDTGDPAEIRWEGSSYNVKMSLNSTGTAWQLAPTSDNVTTINIGSLGASRPSTVTIIGRTVTLRASHDSFNYGGFRGASNGTTSSSARIETKHASGTTRAIIMFQDTSNLYFAPDNSLCELGSTGLNWNGVFTQTVQIREQAAADTNITAYGQLWVKNTAPCQLWYTDDTGADTQIV